MNLLVTGAFSWTRDELAELKSLGHNVVFMQHEKDKLPCKADWVEGIIGNGIFLTHPIESFTSLKYIQLTSAGYDRVPMEYIKKHHIQIFNARGVYSIPMAEFVLTSVLDLYKRNRYFRENQKKRLWDKCRNIKELYGKNVCIIGCGSVGTECAKRFKAFECRVIGIDLAPFSSQYYDKIEDLEKLNNVIEISDIVVLTLPLTGQTKYLIDATRLSKLKNGTIIVNVARGAIIDTKSLIEELKNGRVSAVLDVFEMEPLDSHNLLWDFENVIITPHNSFVGEGNHERMINIIYNNLEVNNESISDFTQK